ncbi:MAG: hypothetical protein H6835_00695 [Planctomycetes bacterium]|nr:hypothetical protein [Planctomycetota bacterium]
MSADKRDEHRRKALRRLLQAGDANLTVRSEELRWLLDEVGRLQQGNDRLRRQNRRLRLRAGETGEVDGDEHDVDDAPEQA